MTKNTECLQNKYKAIGARIPKCLLDRVKKQVTKQETTLSRFVRYSLEQALNKLERKKGDRS